MADKKDCTSLSMCYILHLADGFLLELGVTDGKDLVYDKDFGLKVGCNGEAEADSHTAGVALHGGVDVSLAAGKVHYLIEFAANLLLGHAHDGAVHVDVLAACHLGVEAGADLQQGGDTATDANLTGRRGCDSRKELKQGALACTVLADDAHNISLLNVQVDVLQGPHIVAVTLLGAVISLSNLQEWVFLVEHIHCPPAVEVVADGAGGDQTKSILLAYIFYLNSIHIQSRLNGVHKTALYLVEDNYAKYQQYAHEGETIAQSGPGEEALPQSGVLEGLDDGGHGVQQHDGAEGLVCDHADRVYDRSCVHPELHDEGEEDGKVAVFCGH